jgi:membrane protease YdiL (CAAX protease family)
MIGTSPSRPARPLASLLAILLFPLTLGLYAAPHVYNILRVLVKHHPGFRSLHPLAFEKVTNRCVLVFAVLLLVPLVRRSGLAPEIGRALRLDGPRARTLAGALLLGLLSMGALYLAGLALGGYRPDPANELTLAFLGAAVTGALFIGFFEETFFRGFVFGALRTRASFWPAAVGASVFFALIHFVQPGLPRSPRWAGWADAAALLSSAFTSFDPARDVPYLCTLFVMGLTLCVLYQRKGHLAWCIGLHAGWVLAMQLGNQLFDRDFDRLVWLFTQSGYVGKGLIALPVVTGFLLWSVSRPAEQPDLARKRSTM